jgi:hypothetical protein
VGHRVTLQIRGLEVVFGIRLPRALTTAFIDQALKASEGLAGLSASMRGLIAARTAVMTAVATIDTHDHSFCSLPSAPDDPKRWAAAWRQTTIPHASADPGHPHLSGIGPQTASRYKCQLRHCHTINDEQGQGRSGPPPRHYHARNAAGRDRRPHPAPKRSDVQGGSSRRRRFCCTGQSLADCDFNLGACPSNVIFEESTLYTLHVIAS